VNPRVLQPRNNMQYLRTQQKLAIHTQQLHLQNFIDHYQIRPSFNK
jgi:hypothetical protein